MRARTPIIACAAAALACAGAIGWAAERQRPAAAPAIVRIGATPDARQVTFTVALARSSAREQALDRLLAGLGDPQSPSYRHFVDAATFGRRYGAPAERVARVADWLRSRGMRVATPTPQHLSLDVTATAGQLQAAFGVALGDYRDRSGTTWHEPDTVPRIPTPLAGDVADVAGLSDRPAVSMIAEAGAPGFGYDAAELARIYGFTDMYSRNFHGEGQSVAIINFVPFRQQDIDAFDADGHRTGLPPVTRVKVNGGAVADGDAYQEPALDIETIRGLAPQAAIYEYEAPNNSSSYKAAIDQIVADQKAKTISLSWGGCDYGNRPDRDLLDDSLAAAAAAGINMVVASGDYGAYDCWGSDSVPGSDQRRAMVDWPSCTPWAIAVGGTRVALDAQGQLVEETGWESWMRNVGSGGGVSPVVPRPIYQVPYTRADAGGKRQCPDVAALADGNTGYRIVFDDKDGTGPYSRRVGGTSGAAPLWAAAIALIQQQAAKSGISNLGHLTPLLYRAALSGTPGLVDITRGGNLLQDAGPGYDYATGLGSPRVAALADTIIANQVR